jgi:hypothetical protein
LEPVSGSHDALFAACFQFIFSTARPRGGTSVVKVL